MEHSGNRIRIADALAAANSLMNKGVDILYESNDKLVSHPPHYQSKSGLEVIDVIEAFTEGLEGIEATDTGNIIKYACRWKQKNGVQDLKKIMWYCQHLIDHLENEVLPAEIAETENEINRCMMRNQNEDFLRRLSKKPFISWEAN